MNFKDIVTEQTKQHLDAINAAREELTVAWIAKYGFQPDQCELVQQQDIDGITRFWIEGRADRCATHRAEIVETRVELLRAQTHVQSMEFTLKKISEVLDLVDQTFDALGGSRYRVITDAARKIIAVGLESPPKIPERF